MQARRLGLNVALLATVLATGSGCNKGDDSSATGTDTDTGGDPGTGTDTGDGTDDGQGDDSGGGTGGDGGDGGDTEGDGESDPGDPCIETEHPIGFEELTPLGFSASDVVEAVAGPHDTQLLWLDPAEPHVPWPGEITDLTIGVSYEDGEVVYLESEVDPESEWDDYECESFLRLGVVVGFATADGRFDEHWDVTIWVRDLAEVEYRHEIDLDAMEGTFSRDDIILGEDTELRYLDTVGRFDEDGTTGAIILHTHHDVGGGVGSEGRGPIACWPDISGCE